MKTKMPFSPIAENERRSDELTNTLVFVREVTAKYSGARRACIQIREPSDIRNFAAGVLKDNSREHFVAVFLDNAHHVISYSVISIGTANSTQVHPREVFQHAILAGACAVVVAHNHPSGKLEASQEDRVITRRLVEAGELIGIPVLDHILFSDEGFVSFKDRGWLQ